MWCLESSWFTTLLLWLWRASFLCVFHWATHWKALYVNSHLIGSYYFISNVPTLSCGTCLCCWRYCCWNLTISLFSCLTFSFIPVFVFVSVLKVNCQGLSFLGCAYSLPTAPLNGSTSLIFFSACFLLVYRKAINLSVSLYPVTVLKSFSFLRVFRVSCQNHRICKQEYLAFFSSCFSPSLVLLPTRPKAFKHNTE